MVGKLQMFIIIKGISWVETEFLNKPIIIDWLVKIHLLLLNCLLPYALGCSQYLSGNKDIPGRTKVSPTIELIGSINCL